MYEALPDPTEVNTQKSWNTSYGYNTQEQSVASVEGGPDASDNENSLVPHLLRTAPRIGSTKESLGIQSGRPIRTLGRNSLGQLRIFDESGNEVSNPSETIAPESEPHISSPEPESQHRRRKAFFEACDCRSIKRARLEEEKSDPGSDDVSHILLSSDSSDRDDTPCPELEAVPGVSYYDADDDVHRCRACGWEVWRPSGECTGCGRGEPGYYECTSYTQDSPEGVPRWKERKMDFYPGIGLTSDGPEDDLESEFREELTGRYLDGKSAYDTDSNIEDDEYEINSFIDDSPIEDIVDDEEEKELLATQQDYEQLYHQLSKSHERLEKKHYALMDDHEELRRDFLGSDYSDSDDPLFDVVDIEIKDPPVSEVVLSEVHGDSQASAISTRRLRSRVDAFIAADEDGWYNVSLLSTGDNHTMEELEL
jgi:hypothetical protein